jgi:hypothetical protein
VIVVRCANGVVLWQVRRITRQTSALHCVQDGIEYTYQVGADASQETALVSAAGHSVTLRGAITQIVQLDL